MNTPHRPREADFWSTAPFSRSGMRLFNGLGSSVSCSTQATSLRKATWSSPCLELRATVDGVGARSRDRRTARGPLEMPVHERWRELAWLRLALRRHVVWCEYPRAFRCWFSNKSDSEANGARSSVRCVAAVGLPAARARGATGHRRAWHMPRFVPRPVARRRLLVLINGRTGLFEQPAHSPRANPADSKSRSWFIYVNSGP